MTKHCNHIIIFFFFFDWDLHSNEIYLIISAAAYSKEAKKYGIVFASSDKYYYKSIGKKYDLILFPVLIHFSNYGKSNKIYDGKVKSKEDLIIWMQKAIHGSITEIHSIEEIKNDFENKKEISYIYFGNNNEELKIFKNKEEKDNENIYGHVKDEKIIKKYGIKSNKIVYTI